MPAFEAGTKPSITPEMVAAARAGDTSTIQQLLAAGQCIDAADSNGDSALHMAAEQGHTDAVSLLLGMGAKMGEAPKTGSMSVLQKAMHGTAPGCAEVI